MKTALIVEEFEPLQRMYETMAKYFRQSSGKQFTLLIAGSLDQARFVIQTSKPDTIGFSSSGLPDGRSVDLISELVQKGYRGQMVAASGGPDERDLQLKAGCQHESAKNVLVEKLAEVMGL